MKTFLLLGSLSGFLGVALGAFGAHALKGRISPELLTVWQTAVQYHLVHALALVLIAIICQLQPQPSLARLAGWLLLAGTVLFSGSLYAMALSGLRMLGAITPFGGIAFLLGWLLLAVAAFRSAS